MEVAAPPALLRIATTSQAGRSNKLRVCGRLPSTEDDPRRIHPAANHRNVFDQLYPADCSQEELCSSILPDLLQTVFSTGSNRSDACLLSFGGSVKDKETCVYGAMAPQLGVFHTALAWTFRLVEEYKSKVPEFRASVRLSAVHLSQRESRMDDLLCQFSTDRHRPLSLASDPALGQHISGLTEVRVDGLEQGMFYLNTVLDHRTVEDEESHRCSHLFVYISVYGFQSSCGTVSGGRGRLALIDLGLGEKNSTKGGETFPVIGNMLLALCQGQKHLPSKDSLLCQLLQCSLSTSKNTTLLCHMGRGSDAENMVQMAAKLARARSKSRKQQRFPPSSSSPSVSSAASRLRSDIESSSEQSGAETVIFLGPSASLKSASLARPTSLSTPCTPTRSPSVASKVTQLSSHSGRSRASGQSRGSSGSDASRVTPHACPPMLQGHTPFFSTASKLYDEVCSPSSSTAPEIGVQAYGGRAMDDRGDFGITIAEPKKRKKSDIDEEKRQAILLWMDGHEPSEEDDSLSLPLPSSDDGWLPSVPPKGSNAALPLPSVPTLLERKGLRRSSSLKDATGDLVIERDALREGSREQLALGAGRSILSAPQTLLSNLSLDLSPLTSPLASPICCPPPTSRWRALEDILEMDEESLMESLRSLTKEQLEATPFSLLSVDALKEEKDRLKREIEEEGRKNEEEDDDLERAMAASVSSIQSHEILTRIEQLPMDPAPREATASVQQSQLSQLSQQSNQSSVSRTTSDREMDMYRRASALEEYAAERMRELGEKYPAHPLSVPPPSQALGGKKRFGSFGCCAPQDSMLSSGVAPSGEDSVSAEIRQEEEKRKEELRKLKDSLKAEELVLRKRREEIKKQLGHRDPLAPLTACARSVGQQMRQFGRQMRPSQSSDLHSLPSTPNVHRKFERAPSLGNVMEEKDDKTDRKPSIVEPDTPATFHSAEVPLRVGLSPSRPPRQPVLELKQLAPRMKTDKEGRHRRSESASQLNVPSTSSSGSRKHSADSARPREFDSLGRDWRVRGGERVERTERSAEKERKRRSKERRGSHDTDMQLRSPYAKMTPARTSNAADAGSSGKGSSGRGSSGRGSDIPSSLPVKSDRHRESYSASSGYESATGDYYRYHSSKDSASKISRLIDRNSQPAKLFDSFHRVQSDRPIHKTTLPREVERLREQQRRLRKELGDAKRRIGQSEEAGLDRTSDTLGALGVATLRETLAQENKILEKRLVACRNHALMVTCLL